MDDTGPLAGGRRARVRLRELTVHAVALVGEGANLQTWADVRKSKEGQPMDEQTKALTLPKGAQEGMLEGLGKAIEVLSGLLDMVKGAQLTDDAAATVPPEVAEAVERTGMMVAALGDQFEGGAPPPGGDAGGGPEMTGEEMALTKAVSKGIAKQLVTVFHGVKKRKVTMSFEKAMQVHSGLLQKLFSIASELAPMLNDMGDDGGGGSIDDVLGKPPPAGGGDGTDKTNKNAPPGGAGPGGVVPPPVVPPPVTPPEGVMKQLADIGAKLDALGGAVQKVAKSRPPANAPGGGGGALDATPPPSAEKVSYGTGVNMSKAIREREAAAAKK